jgi:formiminoglutamase
MTPPYRPPDRAHWQGRKSSGREYVHENIRVLDLLSASLPDHNEKTPVLLGYACDEGVSRNLGRPGAAEGPNAIRQALGRMPLLRSAPRPLWDAGDVVCPDGDLEATQEFFSAQVSRLVREGSFPLALGGGHDIAYAHFIGVQQALGPNVHLGILNFDAHLDLREPKPRGHSGSPFLQVARHCREKNLPFSYACVGARPDANPMELWDRASDLGVRVVGRNDLQPGRLEGALSAIRDFLEPLDALYLTIDLDGFSSAFAPGVSAASPMGFSPDTFLPCFDFILESGKVRSMDVAELNPAHDRDGQTAVLAASLIHRVLHQEGLF